MQKNKYFQKTNKPASQSHSLSSKVLLQLSEITNHSKEKSNIAQNFTDRSQVQPLSSLQNLLEGKSAKKLKQNPKPNQKKDSYVKKNISLSNTVLKQIMQMSGSLPMNGNSFSSTRLKQNDNDLIILSKKDLQKGKGISQNKNSRKLLLYENKENQEKIVSKSKSSYGQALKGEGILCSIKIQPMDQLKSSHLSSTQKRDSFDARRSSFSSRRSSINLFPQDDYSAESKIRQIRKSFIGKISSEELNNFGQVQNNQKVENFLKKSPLNFEQYSTEMNKNIISKQTCPNDTQMSPKEKKQLRQKCLYKLDELNIIEEDIKKDAGNFINFWDALIHAEKNLKFYKSHQKEIKNQYQEIQNIKNSLNNLLFEENKRYLQQKRKSNNNETLQKQNILLEAEKIHSEVKKKVFRKDLEEMMIFNMKVVLPSSQLMQSSVSCLNSNINSSLSFSNLTILQLYEQLINQKGCKKYGMILKKQINNMNIYDSRTMNEYLRRLYELQNCFHRIQNEDPQNQSCYLERIEDLIQKIQQTSSQFQTARKKLDEIERRIRQNQRIKEKSEAQVRNLLDLMSENIFNEYKMFQTGGKQQTPKKVASLQDSGINESFCESDKRIEEFRELVSKKYENLFRRYESVKEERRVLEESLKFYN